MASWSAWSRGDDLSRTLRSRDTTVSHPRQGQAPVARRARHGSAPHSPDAHSACTDLDRQPDGRLQASTDAKAHMTAGITAGAQTEFGESDNKTRRRAPPCAAVRRCAAGCRLHTPATPRPTSRSTIHDDAAWWRALATCSHQWCHVGCPTSLMARLAGFHSWRNSSRFATHLPISAYSPRTTDVSHPEFSLGGAGILPA